MRESIFFASIRSLFVALFGVIGLSLGVILFIGILDALITKEEGNPDIAHTYSPEILPNASGIRKSLSKSAPVILQLNINGAIGADNLNRHTVERQLIESRERSLKDNRVKAILLNIDSPGGTVIDADGIYQAIKAYKTKFKVPVYAYIDGLCASGGMYVAVAADKIFASDVSLIGSIGVLSPAFPNVSQLMDKIGVQALTISAGKGKDELNPTRPWTATEGDSIKAIIDYYYKQFVNHVVENRPNLDKTKLIEEYGANIYPAEQAQEYGYIDEGKSSYNETLRLLAKKIGIEDDYYQVIQLESKNWLSEIFKSENKLLKGEVSHRIELTSELHPQLSNQFLYLYRP